MSQVRSQISNLDSFPLRTLHPEIITFKIQSISDVWNEEVCVSIGQSCIREAESTGYVFSLSLPPSPPQLVPLLPGCLPYGFWTFLVNPYDDKSKIQRAGTQEAKFMGSFKPYRHGLRLLPTDSISFLSLREMLPLLLSPSRKYHQVHQDYPR